MMQWKEKMHMIRLEKKKKVQCRLKSKTIIIVVLGHNEFLRISHGETVNEMSNII